MIENRHNLEQALERIAKGETAQSVFEPGYSTLYIEWAAQNREAKKLMSINEQAISLERAITHRFVDEGNHRLSTPAKREQLLHGHMFWVSRDGRTFDWNSLEELEREINLERLLFISPTLESHENDLRRLARKQSMALVAYNLESTGYAIESSEASGALLEFNVRHPHGHYRVKVNLNQNAAEPWSYDFSDMDHPEHGVRTVREGDIESQFGPEQKVMEGNAAEPLKAWIQSKQNQALVDPSLNAMAAVYAVNQAMHMRDARITNGTMPAQKNETQKQTQVEPKFEAKNKIEDVKRTEKVDDRAEAEAEAKHRLKQKIQMEQEARQERIDQRRKQTRRMGAGAAVAVTGIAASFGAGAFGLTYFVNFM